MFYFFCHLREHGTETQRAIIFYKSHIEWKKRIEKLIKNLDAFHHSGTVCQMGYRKTD